jgi:hypothetical protein
MSLLQLQASNDTKKYGSKTDVDWPGNIKGLMLKKDETARMMLQKKHALFRILSMAMFAITVISYLL